MSAVGPWCNAMWNFPVVLLSGVVISGMVSGSHLLRCLSQTVIKLWSAHFYISSAAPCSKQRVLQLTDEQRTGGETGRYRVHAGGAGGNHIGTHVEKHSMCFWCISYEKCCFIMHCSVLRFWAVWLFIQTNGKKACKIHFCIVSICF